MTGFVSSPGANVLSSNSKTSFTSRTSPTTLPTHPKRRPRVSNKSLPSNPPKATVTTAPPLLPKLSGLRHYLQSLPRSSQQLTIVLFTTRHCPQCTSVSRRLQHLIRTHRYDLLPNIKLYEVDISEKENQQVGKMLNVEWVPFMQVYVWKGDGEEKGVGVVEERMVKGGGSMRWLEERIEWFNKGGFRGEEWALGGVGEAVKL